MGFATVMLSFASANSGLIPPAVAIVLPAESTNTGIASGTCGTYVKEA
jgi:hypothetical protein